MCKGVSRQFVFKSYRQGVVYRMTWDGDDTDVDLLLNVHVWLWAAACAVAFAVYYSYEECRRNPDFHDQMHTLSGIIIYGQALFGTLLSGFGGAVLLASAKRVHGDAWAVGMLLWMFVGLLVVVHYDVRAYRTVHFTALGMLLVAGTLYLWRVVSDQGWMLWYWFAVSTALFVVVLGVNVCFTQWAPPFLTVQAVVEIIWVLALAGAVMGYALWGG
jgi:hypothetical protein